MPLAPKRAISTFRYAVFFDGVDDYAVIEPFTVYGWDEITIQEWVYFYHPKANDWWSKTNMIGDIWVDVPSTFIGMDNRFDYTLLKSLFATRTAIGYRRDYYYDVFAYRNTWINLGRRFTSTREFSIWVNASRVYSDTVPADEKTILEWNPESATYPHRYRRYVIGANVELFEFMRQHQHSLLIYSRAPSEREITHNMLYPENPIRNGLVVWLLAHPNYVEDIDGDKVLEWIDLSGFNNHAKLYGARLVELIKTPSRILTPIRASPVAR